MNVETILMENYGLTLPVPPKPVALYKPVRQAGNLLFLAGQTATIDGKLLHPGVLGSTLSVEEGILSARLAALNLLAVLNEYLDGALERVSQIVQLTGYIRSAPGFGAQPAVLNGASELFYTVFGDNGIAARAALGTNELPGGASVEVMAVVELKES